MSFTFASTCSASSTNVENVVFLSTSSDTREDLDFQFDEDEEAHKLERKHNFTDWLVFQIVLIFLYL